MSRHILPSMRYFNHLRTHRERLALTQWVVSKSVDIPLDRYGRLENGKTEPSYAEAHTLGQFFKVKPVALFPVEEHARAS
jgi:DNA-binding XRE family transcriptional regulator